MYYTIKDVESLKYDPVVGPHIKLNRYSTAEDYYTAMNYYTLSNQASKQIEDGLQPYLLNEDSMEMEMFPFVLVEDIFIDMDSKGNIGLCTPSQVTYVEPTTPLIWR